MKLLFDENLPPKLPHLLAALFPGSAHLRDFGLRGQPDEDVWEYAYANGYTIMTKDADFEQRCRLYSTPPKVVWLRVGNCTRKQLAQLLASRQADIHALDEDLFEVILILP